jgi:hypothetical protein
MTELVAYCGLTCQTCPIYLATRQENKEEQARMRAEIVQLCKEHYGLKYELDDITDCDGCRTEGGRLLSACKKCPVRKCAKQKGLENCAYCTEYACVQLEAFFGTEPTARVRLDEIRSGILKSMRP